MANRYRELEKRWEVMEVHWSRQLGQVRDLLWPVLANTCMTLFGWCCVYKRRADQTFMELMFRKSDNEVKDGLFNGLICLISVAILSFFMVILAIYKMKRFIHAWLTISCLMIMFCVSYQFFDTLISEFVMESPVTAAIITSVYGAVGCLAYFTDQLPLHVHQSYVVTNCSLVSMFYLRVLPNTTTWFLLASIIIWDAFAVLTPLGPLRQITGFAHDYGEDILRFLMFSTGEDTESNRVTYQLHTKEPRFVAGNDNMILACNADAVREMNDEVLAEVHQNVDVLSTTSSLDTESDEAEVTSEKGMEECKHEIKTKKTAFEALNDSSARLGMGDFVFYSLLVGRAACSGSILATIAPVVGVVIGLVVTLTLMTDGDETTPALPVSVFFGMSLHFGTLYLVEPMMNSLFVI